MRRKNLLTVALSGLLLLSAPAGVAFAQAGGGQSPGGSPSQRPSMTPPDQQATTDTAPAKVDDKKFLKQAAQGGMTEVELGKLAAQKASNGDVKQFAQKMVDDHSKANGQLKEIASKENVQIPDALDSKHQSRIDKLSKLSGPDFDKAYVKDQLKDHQSDVKDFSAEAQNGSDPNVKAFASSTLPTLQQHLELVKNLNKKGTN